VVFIFNIKLILIWENAFIRHRITMIMVCVCFYIVRLVKFVVNNYTYKGSRFKILQLLLIIKKILMANTYNVIFKFKDICNGSE